MASKKNRMTNEINAGSMADIAFLLLIFFLVTTTIAEDKGVLIKLPPWSNEPPPPLVLNTRNVYSVLVNADNQLLVRGELMDIKTLKENTKKFIANPENAPNMAVAPDQALISLKNDRGTKYSTYIEVYNELKSAYSELWDDAALKKYKRPMSELNGAEEDEIKKEIPFVISEAEPTGFGAEQ